MEKNNKIFYQIFSATFPECKLDVMLTADDHVVINTGKNLLWLKREEGKYRTLTDKEILLYSISASLSLQGEKTNVFFQNIEEILNGINFNNKTLQ